MNNNELTKEEKVLKEIKTYIDYSVYNAKDAENKEHILSNIIRVIWVTINEYNDTKRLEKFER